MLTLLKPNLVGTITKTPFFQFFLISSSSLLTLSLFSSLPTFYYSLLFLSGFGYCLFSLILSSLAPLDEAAGLVYFVDTECGPRMPPLCNLNAFKWPILSKYSLKINSIFEFTWLLELKSISFYLWWGCLLIVLRR